MNTHHSLSLLIPRTPVAMSSLNEAAAHASSRYRERDFGIGYGNSSGYALLKRYTSDWGMPCFRFR